jgi:hypothetical protein
MTRNININYNVISLNYNQYMAEAKGSDAVAPERLPDFGTALEIAGG